MTKKLFAVVLLSLAVAACEPGTENNSNANSNATPNTPAASTPVAVAVAPSPEPNASVKPQVKAGDKVKVTINGSTADATVISVDEKAGKVTVKLQGQKEEKTVAIADVRKE